MQLERPLEGQLVVVVDPPSVAENHVLLVDPHAVAAGDLFQRAVLPADARVVCRKDDLAMRPVPADDDFLQLFQAGREARAFCGVTFVTNLNRH